MLALRNNNGIVRNNDGILVNNEINSLTIVGVNYFKFQFMSSGPVDINWGDGDNTVYSTAQSSYIAPSHPYPSTGTWNINITNPQNITALYFNYGSTWNGDKINTNVSWFSQFYNLNRLEIISMGTTFSGDLSIIMEQYLIHLTYLNLNLRGITDYTFQINTEKCKNTWSRLTYLAVIIHTDKNHCIFGSFSDISINYDIEAFFFGDPNNGDILYLSGNLDGIIKNGYSKLSIFEIGTYSNCSCSLDLDDWVIPDTLLNLQINVPSLFYVQNFNFKNIKGLQLHQLLDSDVSNNVSLNTILGDASPSNHLVIRFYASNYHTIKFNISNCVGYTGLTLSALPGYNKSYGDITNLTHNSSSINDGLYLLGGSNDNSIIGTLSSNLGGSIDLEYVDVTITADVYKSLIQTRKQSVFISLPNFTGDISNVSIPLNVYRHIINYMPNLYCDITTIIFGTWWKSSPSYTELHFHNNPHFTGDLSTLTLWGNKAIIDLSNCAYTNIPGFYRNIFTNRNTCLKAAGGTTTLYTQGNVDNSSLTGIYKLGNLGTYSGNYNNLTEVQIDNLANGLDYTGTGSNTPWTDKEKIWCLVNFNNSSTDSSKRYRFSTSY